MSDCITIGEPEWSAITFSIDKGIWLIKMSKDGIRFNREDYPDYLAGDFAKQFIELLEKQFTVKFEKRETECE